MGGRADPSDSQAEGRGFDPHRPLQIRFLPQSAEPFPVIPPVNQLPKPVETPQYPRDHERTSVGLIRTMVRRMDQSFR